MSDNAFSNAFEAAVSHLQGLFSSVHAQAAAETDDLVTLAAIPWNKGMKNPDWNPLDHPKDHEGKFVEKTAGTYLFGKAKTAFESTFKDLLKAAPYTLQPGESMVRVDFSTKPPTSMLVVRHVDGTMDYLFKGLSSPKTAKWKMVVPGSDIEKAASGVPSKDGFYSTIEIDSVPAVEVGGANLDEAQKNLQDKADLHALKKKLTGSDESNELVVAAPSDVIPVESKTPDVPESAPEAPAAKTLVKKYAHVNGASFEVYADGSVQKFKADGTPYAQTGLTEKKVQASGTWSEVAADTPSTAPESVPEAPAAPTPTPDPEPVPDAPETPSEDSAKPGVKAVYQHVAGATLKVYEDGTTQKFKADGTPYATSGLTEDKVIASGTWTKVSGEAAPEAPKTEAPAPTTPKASKPLKAAYKHADGATFHVYEDGTVEKFKADGTPYAQTGLTEKKVQASGTWSKIEDEPEAPKAPLTETVYFDPPASKPTDAEAEDDLSEPEAPVEAPVEAPKGSDGVDSLIDVSTWAKTGAQLGSNPGGFYTDPDGNKYYVKQSKSDLHAQSEVLARKLYDLTGISSAKLQLADVGGGKIGTASPLVAGAQNNFKQMLSDASYKEKLHEGFVVDAWLANWDVVGLGFDNVMTDGNGDPVRIDPGGALLFRAMGAPKGNAFGPKVSELDTLLDAYTNSNSAKAFGDISHESLMKSAARVLAVTDEQIDEAVDSVGIKDSAVSEGLKKTLKDRRDFIGAELPEAKDYLPGNETEEEPVADWAEQLMGDWSEPTPSAWDKAESLAKDTVDTWSGAADVSESKKKSIVSALTEGILAASDSTVEAVYSSSNSDHVTAFFTSPTKGDFFITHTGDSFIMDQADLSLKSDYLLDTSQDYISTIPLPDDAPESQAYPDHVESAIKTMETYAANGSYGKILPDTLYALPEVVKKNDDWGSKTTLAYGFTDKGFHLWAWDDGSVVHGMAYDKVPVSEVTMNAYGMVPLADIPKESLPLEAPSPTPDTPDAPDSSATPASPDTVVKVYSHPKTGTYVEITADGTLTKFKADGTPYKSTNLTTQTLEESWLPVDPAVHAGTPKAAPKVSSKASKAGASSTPPTTHVQSNGAVLYSTSSKAVTWVDDDGKSWIGAPKDDKYFAVTDSGQITHKYVYGSDKPGTPVTKPSTKFLFETDPDLAGDQSKFTFTDSDLDEFNEYESWASFGDDMGTIFVGANGSSYDAPKYTEDHLDTIRRRLALIQAFRADKDRFSKLSTSEKSRLTRAERYRRWQLAVITTTMDAIAGNDVNYAMASDAYAASDNISKGLPTYHSYALTNAVGQLRRAVQSHWAKNEVGLNIADGNQLTGSWSHDSLLMTPSNVQKVADYFQKQGFPWAAILPSLEAKQAYTALYQYSPPNPDLDSFASHVNGIVAQIGIYNATLSYKEWKKQSPSLDYDPDILSSPDLPPTAYLSDPVLYDFNYGYEYSDNLVKSLFSYSTSTSTVKIAPIKAYLAAVESKSAEAKYISGSGAYLSKKSSGQTLLDGFLTSPSWTLNKSETIDLAKFYQSATAQDIQAKYGMPDTEATKNFASVAKVWASKVLDTLPPATDAEVEFKPIKTVDDLPPKPSDIPEDSWALIWGALSNDPKTMELLEPYLHNTSPDFSLPASVNDALLDGMPKNLVALSRFAAAADYKLGGVVTPIQMTLVNWAKQGRFIADPGVQFFTLDNGDQKFNIPTLPGDQWVKTSDANALIKKPDGSMVYVTSTSSWGAKELTYSNVPSYKVATYDQDYENSWNVHKNEFTHDFVSKYLNISQDTFDRFVEARDSKQDFEDIYYPAISSALPGDTQVYLKYNFSHNPNFAGTGLDKEIASLSDSMRKALHNALETGDNEFLDIFLFAHGKGYLTDDDGAPIGGSLSGQTVKKAKHAAGASSDLKLFPVSHNLGGVHTKYAWADQHGNQWMSKPFTSAGSEAKGRIHMEHYSMELSRLFGFRAPQSRVENVNGQYSYLQLLAPSKKNLESSSHADLTDQQLTQVMEEQVIDWLIGNHDSHGGNLLFAEGTGDIIGIDKGAAFKWYGQDLLKIGYLPPQHAVATWYSDFFVATMNGQVTKERADMVKDAVLKKAAIMSSKYDDITSDYLDRAFEDVKKFPSTYPTAASLKAAVMERKAALFEDFSALYQDLYERSGWEWEAPDKDAYLPKQIGTAHVSISPDYISAVSAAKTHGTSLFIGVGEVRNGYVQVFETVKPNKKDKTLRGQMHLETSASAVLEAWLNQQTIEHKSGYAKPVVDPQVAQQNKASELPLVQDIHNALVQAHITVNSHINKGDFSYNQGTLSNAQSQIDNLKATLAAVQAHEVDNPEKPYSEFPVKFVTAEQQAAWIDAAQTLIKQHDMVTSAMDQKVKTTVLFPDETPITAPSYSFTAGLDISGNPKVLQKVTLDGETIAKWSDGNYVLESGGKKSKTTPNAFENMASQGGAVKVLDLPEDEAVDQASVAPVSVNTGLEVVSVVKHPAQAYTGKFQDDGSVIEQDINNGWIGGQEYEIKFGAVTIRYQTNESENYKTHRGMLRFEVDDWTGNQPELEKVFQVLRTMGLELEEPDETAMELLYWRNQEDIANDRSVPYDLKVILADLRQRPDTLSQEEELALHRAAWRKYYGDEKMDQFAANEWWIPTFPNNSYESYKQGSVSGRPRWRAVNAPDLKKVKKAWKNTLPRHSVYTGNEGVLKIAKSGALLSTEERFRVLGQWIDGMSSSADQHQHGSSGSLYTRQNLGPKSSTSQHGVHIWFEPHIVNFQSNYAFQNDKFGEVSYKKNVPFDPADYLGHGGEGNELMIEHAISVMDDLAVAVVSASFRDQILQFYKSIGIEEIRGIPVSERFVTSTDEAQKTVDKVWQMALEADKNGGN